jgi:hypothetical protein
MAMRPDGRANPNDLTETFQFVELCAQLGVKILNSRCNLNAVAQ